MISKRTRDGNDPASGRGRLAFKARLARLVSPGDGYGETVAHAPELTLREVLRRFWPDARPYRRWLPLLVALIAIGAAITTAEIWLFKLVVDEVLVPGDIDAMVWIAVAYVGLTLLSAAVSFGDDYLGTWIAERFLLSLRVRVLDHVQRLSLDVFNRHRLGDLVTRISSDVQQIETLVLSGIADGLSAILRILFFGTALFILDWQLALVALVAAPAFWLDRQALLPPDQARLAREAPPRRLAQLARRGDLLQRRARAGDELPGRRHRALSPPERRRRRGRAGGGSHPWPVHAR